MRVRRKELLAGIRLRLAELRTGVRSRRTDQVRAEIRPVCRRAGYRAALRRRAASRQLDLVDLLVVSP
jgi:hypothetical protein